MKSLRILNHFNLELKLQKKETSAHTVHSALQWDNKDVWIKKTDVSVFKVHPDYESIKFSLWIGKQKEQQLHNVQQRPEHRE